MIFIPILEKQKKEIIFFKAKLKHVKKNYEAENFSNIKPSDIILGSYSFIDSVFNTKNQEGKEVVEFLRNGSIHSHSPFLISTKFSSDKPYYNLYEIESFPKRVAKGLDNLYGTLLLDLKNEIPNQCSKGRCIDLEKIGLIEHITNEKLELLEMIANSLSRGEKNNYQKLLKDNELMDLLLTIDFLKLIDLEKIKSIKLDIEIYEKVLQPLCFINIKEGKSLQNLYSIAENNTRVYEVLTKLYRIVYNKPIKVDKSKIKVKQQTETLKEVS